MICKETEKIIDNLLRLKVDNAGDNDNNKIASIMSKTHDNRTKEEKETLCVHVLNQLLDKNQNNKIASVHPRVGEVAEFQSLLRGLV
jgi:hypothetical protein